MKLKKTNNSTAQLIGIREFSRNGVMTAGGDELVFFIVKPTNISVLSPESVADKVQHLMRLLIAQPDLDICCLDDQECFDGNKEFLAQRLESETNPKIRELLQYDLRFLDDIQIQMATARQFLFIVRARSQSEEQSFARLNQIYQAIVAQGFDARRAATDDIKRFLTHYFLRTIPEMPIADIDGTEAVRNKWMIPD